MFIAGIVFAIIAGFHVALLLLRSISLWAARKYLRDTDYPEYRTALAEQRENIQKSIANAESISVTPVMIITLVCMALSLIFLFLQ
jgi:1,4-dihydroxy-2-naphthoate octaprenyltransferase